MAKSTVWVLSTCIPEEQVPCCPSVYTSAEAAVAFFDEMMRAEWEANEPEDEETCEKLAYPGDPLDAHDILREWNENWGCWEITEHEIEI